MFQRTHPQPTHTDQTSRICSRGALHPAWKAYDSWHTLTVHRATWSPPPQRPVRGSGLLPAMRAHCTTRVRWMYVSVPRSEWDRLPDIGPHLTPGHAQSGMPSLVWFWKASGGGSPGSPGDYSSTTTPRHARGAQDGILLVALADGRRETPARSQRFTAAR